MGYRDMYAQAKEDGSAKQVGTKTFKFSDEGEQIIGMLLNVEQVKNKRFKHPVNKYTFETDEGVFSVIMGQAADKIYGPQLAVGDVYAITYDGKVKLARGNNMNSYTIELLAKGSAGKK